MKTIKEILIERDDMSPEDADILIQEAKDQFDEYMENRDIDSAEKICQDYFGLEPDYLHEFIGFKNEN